MNVQTAIEQPERVKLRIPDFLLLRQSGTFDGYSKSELLDGELWGVPVQEEDELESDAVFPIKLRIEDYLRLHEAGAFERYGKTELIDGVVYAMNPQHRRHMRIKNELAFRLRLALEAIGSTLFVGTEGTVAMPPHDAPEPDILLTSEPDGDGPVPLSSIALLVEVADSSIGFDLEQLAPRYALHGVPEYWIVDARELAIHQMWAPQVEGYGRSQTVKLGKRIVAATIDGLAVETAGIN
jgi:Uma2 family endonuclease